VQDPPAETELPHVFVCEKSPALVPVRRTLVMVSDSAPVFVRVTTEAGLDAPTDWFAKVTLEGERVTVAEIPVPVTGTLCIAPVPLSVRLTVPAMTPAVVGVKLIFRVHVPPAATPAAQVLVCE